MSRQGKHKDGKVSVGIYIEEEKRALLAYLVDLTGQTATDIIMEGVAAKAKALGVMANGKVKPEHEAAIRVIMASYHQKNRNAK